jgi:hypothetical protein
MSFGLLSMLFGLLVVIIPPIIHLLNRRRYDVVNWGAMQFLQISEVTRRRLLLEELLLMALRMGLLAVLVLALAAPFVESATLARWAPQPSRDVVLIFDGSASMTADSTGQSAQDLALQWAEAYLADLAAGDGVAVLQAKQRVVPIVPELSRDLARVRERIAKLSPPAGGCDWPAAVQAALKILSTSQKAEREIVLLSDGQRHSWADEKTLLRWGLLAAELANERASVRPRLWYVNVDSNRKADLPNWALAPLRGNRPIVSVDREVTFRTELQLSGQTEYAPPHRIRLEVDGKPVRDLDAPHAATPAKGKVPFSFRHRFATAGSHLVTVWLEPDPPPDRRPPGYQIKDQLPGDNRQDFAVEVLPALPVLLVDGDPSPKPDQRGTDFLRDALSPARDPHPVVRARVVAAPDFGPESLAGEGLTRPRVLVLSNLEKLTRPQEEAIESFLAEGGGVLVTLGNRVAKEYYNSSLYRDGQGWLPAQLANVDMDLSRPGSTAAHPEPALTSHPALEIFREAPAGGEGTARFRGLSDARFLAWWQLTTPGKNPAGVRVAELRTSSDSFPFLVERSYRAGRVLVCAVPLDNSWGTNLPDLPAFVPLVHELIDYLAGARSADFNLQAGQPLRYRLETDAAPQGFLLQPPQGEARPLAAGPSSPSAYPAQLLRQAHSAWLVYDGTQEIGVYRLMTPENRTVYYVVQPDAEESDLTPCSDQDREAVARILPVQYENDRERMAEARTESGRRQEVWWWFLLGLIALLCGEVWMTRRLVKNR